jgi:hypothetical protein
MEDKHVVATFHGLELVGVFDGHGGKDVKFEESCNKLTFRLPFTFPTIYHKLFFLFS